MKVSLKHGSEIIPTLVTQFPKKDSVQVWFKPIKADSLYVAVEKDNFKKDFTINMKKQKTDTLSLSPDFSGMLPLRERFAISSSIPLVKFDKSKIAVFNKDSIAVPFETEYDDFQQKLYFNFNKDPLEKYKIQLMPGALTDFYEKANDTLTYRIATKNASDYGNLKVVLENSKRFPIIVELTHKTGKIKATAYTENNPIVEFLALEPDKYTLRIIYDDNKNKVWDTGSFMEKRQSEEVIYFPKEIDVRTNWDVEQPFNLGK
jgi:hypothetical protein